MAAGFSSSGDDFIFDTIDTIDVNDFINIPEEDDNNVLGFIDHHRWSPSVDLLRPSSPSALLMAAPPPFLSEDDALARGDFNVDVLDENKLKLAFHEDPQLEFISKIIDDSSDHMAFQGFNDTNDNSSRSSNELVNQGKEEDQFFYTSSPISVLEHNGRIAGASGSSATSSSASSCSAVGFTSNERKHSAPPLSPPEPVPAIPGRARTKRSRPCSTMSSRSLASTPFVQPPPLSDTMENESFGESDPAPCMMMTTTKKKKKKNPAIAVLKDDAAAAAPQPALVRKCMHCEVQKTPQWRAGPMGPKTLCNACGVRYKSGRLFPEYRPAASPTFIPSLHSNSHKKVVEMRIKSSNKPATTVGITGESPALKNCDLIQYIRRRD